MKSLSLIIFLFLIIFHARSQEYEFDIHRKKLSDVIKLEQTLGSEPSKTNYKHMLPAGVAQPILFTRKQHNIPDLQVLYFYYEKDSTFYSIVYEWDESNKTGYLENNKKSQEFMKNLIQKYNDLEKLISKEFGQSKSEGKLSPLSKSEKEGGLTKRDVWNPDDSTEIELTTVISNYYEKKNMVTTNPSHRIRLYVRNTQQKLTPSPKLSQGKIDSLTLVARSLFQTLANKNFEQA
ncbi:hypothetical protein [Xanthocytophaga agilis]|uniref:Uncharacterized protein n=1 Tax=Xanthocytophaga agilis TaxID=3048010 RepID=A0AAE3RCS7_9BACT|nr:hypothetical protein [Xanthocytophaga agilis]MDJ1506080.1 hypothetical protein [Xanthocytophaga agilis]